MSSNISKNNSDEFEIRDASLLMLFWEFFKLGSFTIGGGFTMIPLLQGIVSDRMHWMTADETIDCIALSQSLPGVVAINMATYVGNRKKGFAGALAATIGVALPSLISIIVVIEFLRGIGGNKYIIGALRGTRAAATGLIGWSAYTMGKKVLTDTFSWMLAIAAFLLIVILDVNVIYAILGGIIAGLAWFTYKKRKGGMEV